MPERLLETLWPPCVDSTGGPTSGTKWGKDYSDAQLEALVSSIYSSALDLGPPEVAEMLANALGGYATLDARLDALAAAAAGGAATAKTASLVNWIWNGGLFWSGGDAVAPDGWTAAAGLTVARITAQPSPAGGTPATCKVGRNLIKLVNPDATVRDFYFDVVPAAANGNIGVSGMSWASGVWIKGSVSALVTVHVKSATGVEAEVGAQGASTDWVWSQSAHASEGGRIIPDGGTYVRFIVRMTQAGTAYICGPHCGPGEKAPYYVAPPARRGQLTFGQGPEAELILGIKSVLIVNRPMFIYSGRVFVVNHGSGTGCSVVLYRDGDEIFNSGLVVGASSVDSGAKVPYSVARASCVPGSNLTFGLSAADAALRGITLVVDYIEPEILYDTMSGGNVVF